MRRDDGEEMKLGLIFIPLLLLESGHKPSGDGKEVPFERIIQQNGYGRPIANCPGQSRRGYRVVMNEKEWRDTWKNVVTPGMDPRPPLPPVDFTKQSVLLVFMGLQSTGGFSISISRILENETQFKVFVKSSSPALESPVIQVITFPCQIVKVPKMDKEVKFIDKQ